MKARKRLGSAGKGPGRPRKKAAAKKPTRGSSEKARTKKTVAKKTVAKKTVAKKTAAKKRARVAAQKPSPPPPIGWNTPDNTAELLLHRAGDRRRLFGAAIQPPEEVFVSGGRYAGTASMSSSLSLHAEMLARAREVENTIAELPEEGAPGKHFDGDGAIVFEHACALGCEGIVSKRLGSAYRSGRVDHWLKIKNPVAPAVRREAEEDWGSKRWARGRRT